MSRQKTSLKRIKDWLSYLLIAFLVAISIWAFEMHQARNLRSPDLPLKWLGFAGMTAIVFGYAIRSCRPLWREQRFWTYLSIFFAVHAALGISVLSRVHHAPLGLYAVLTGLEYLVLARYLQVLLNPDR